MRCFRCVSARRFATAAPTVASSPHVSVLTQTHLPGVDPAVHVESIRRVQMMLRDTPVTSRGQRYALLMRLLESMDTALTGEVPLDSAANIISRFSDQALEQTLERFRAITLPDEERPDARALAALQKARERAVVPLWVWPHVPRQDYPELRDVRMPSSINEAYLQTARALLQSIRDEHLASLRTDTVPVDIKREERGEARESVTLGSASVRLGQIARWDKTRLQTLLPEGIHSSRLLRDAVTLHQGELHLLVRDDLRRLVAATEKRVGHPSAVLVDGKRGSGKSASLVALVALAREAGWLAVYLDGEAMMRGGNVRRNASLHHMWDQPSTCAAMCQSILAAQGELLGRLAVKTSGVPLLPNASVDATLKTLKAVLERGAADPEQATAALLWFRNELVVVSDVRVLVAVDNFNCLHNASGYSDMDSAKFRAPLLRAAQLTVPSLFTHLHRQMFLNGVMVAALTHEGGKGCAGFKAAHTAPADVATTPLSLDETAAVFADAQDARTPSAPVQGGPTMAYVHAFTSATPAEVFRFAQYT